MTLTFRTLQRCDRCRSPHRDLCDELRHDLSRVVVQAAEKAAASGRRVPDADLVLDCKSFDWRRSDT